MSYPRAVFLDTCILEQQHFNFSSAAITSFVDVAKKQKLQFLLPDPTAKEILRHIRERSADALKALEDARRKAPFLAKWKGFPQRTNQRLADWEVNKLAQEEWQNFLKQFDTVHLGYEGIKTEMVMTWYDSTRAPFGKGAKRKEFPDAFAVAILDAFATGKTVTVAVVSTDSDMEAACGHFGNLLYFPTLQQLTESLLKDEHGVGKIRAGIAGDVTRLTERIKKNLTRLHFAHAKERYTVQGTNVGSVTIADFRVVAVGHGECTITFEASIDLEADLTWTSRDDPDTEYYEASDRLADSIEITGTAKIKLSAAGDGIAEIPFLEFDHSEALVTATPDRHEE
ncbi:MAG TPA: PIN domain-containing protein [Candidatus Didemnitutus sp.]|jgi:hypothetical protein